MGRLPFAYRVGVFLGQHAVLVGSVLIGLLGLLFFALGSWIHKPSSQMQQVVAQAKPASLTLEDVCRAEREKRLAAFDTHMQAKAYREAVDSVARCAVLLGDQDMKLRLVQAQTADYESTVKSRESSASEKLFAIQGLKNVNPEAAKQYLPQIARLEKRIESDRRAVAETRPIRIGMTAAEVLDSSWGRPQSVNRSTYTFGVHEQWVYGNGNYLYFVDGVLNSVTTSN